MSAYFRMPSLNLPNPVFCDASNLEFFLVMADLDLIDRLFGFLGPDDIARLRRLNRRVYWSIESYSRRAWDIDHFLMKWFDRSVLVQFFDQLERCNAVISGSAALQFLSRKSPYPTSDLDIFLPMENASQFGKWLQEDAGYIFKPRSLGMSIHFDYEIWSMPLRYHLLPGESGMQSELSFGGKFDVFDFYKPAQGDAHHGAAERPHVQLIVVVGDPFKHILSFHSTVVMNVITARYAASLFPYSTFVRHVAWISRRGNYRGDYRQNWRVKYESRGFKFVDDRTPAVRPIGHEFRAWRFLGDAGTWMIPFETRESPDQECVLLEREITFEVVLRSRGPVTTGSYLNIAPR
ncbi:hypothetical protein FKP32DRAFT_1680214 [Trametes sanguinea]|nr:hypothetical protein FKP32DRAFT_1680214 [Trametes sanguinea]